MCAGLLCAGAARAQQSVTEAQSFPLERLRLSTARSGIIDVESGAVAQHLAWDVGLWVGYERNPLILYRLPDGQRVGALVSDRVGSTLSGSVGLYGWVELGLEAPVVLFQTRPKDLPGALEPGSQLTALSATNLGDLRIMGKVRLLRQEDHGVSLALIPAVTLPTGGARGYSGEAGAVFSPELAASRQQGGLRFGANLGAVIRPRTELLNQVVDSELTAHLGVAYRFNEAEQGALPLELDLSLSSAVSATSPFANANQTHLELRAMAAYDASRSVQLLLGSGVGLAHGWGTPDFRVFIGARFRAPEQPEVTPLPPKPIPAAQTPGGGAR